MTTNFNLKGKIVTFEQPKVMGIINVTPDSFYAGSRAGGITNAEIEKNVAERCRRMIEEGVDWLDLGGYSSRPGAEEVSIAEELRRLEAGLAGIRSVSEEIPVSVDTFRAKVAQCCVEKWGADMINDISGGDLDPEMWDVVADLGVPYIAMHMKGDPATMQNHTDYRDVTEEVVEALARKAAALYERGIADVIIDPGFGFAKTLEGNYEMLRNLEAFRMIGAPVLVGVSRKSMIYRALGVDPGESLGGTIAVEAIALLKGADILRVHDVKAARQCVTLNNLMR